MAGGRLDRRAGRSGCGGIRGFRRLSSRRRRLGCRGSAALGTARERRTLGFGSAAAVPRAAAPRRCEASQRRLALGFLKLFRNPALCAVTAVVFWGSGDRGETVLEASPEQARPTTPAAAVGSRGIFRASAAGSLGLARLRQPAPALPRIRDTLLSSRSAGPSAGVAARNMLRCGPVWRATTPAFDATAAV